MTHEPACDCRACDLERRLDATPRGSTLALPRPASPSPALLAIADYARAIGGLRTREEGATMPEDHVCSGAVDGCTSRVPSRGDACATCAERYARELRVMSLARVRASLPVGWDHAASHPIRSELQRIATSWARAHGNLLLCGGTGAGKTSACVALVQRMIRRAEATATPAPDVAFVARARFVSWPAILEGDRQQALGKGEARATKQAVRASLLILDEVGIDADRRSPTLLRYIIDERSRDATKRTIVTTGLTRADLEAKFDPSIARKIIGPTGECLQVFDANTRKPA